MAFRTITPAKLGRGAIAATVSTFYTVPDLTRALVKTIDIANTTAAMLTVTVYLVESGGTAGAANTLIPAAPVAGNGVFQWTGTQVLNSGDTIQAVASVVGSAINVSGGEAI